MTFFPVQPPYPIFNEEDGTPLEDGFIYIGEANQNPITNPITISWDTAGLYPAAQPVRTIGGYPDRNGSPGIIYVNAGAFEDYSILVQDKNGDQIYFERSALSARGGLGGNTVDVIDDLRAISGYDQPIYVRGHSIVGDGGQGTFEWFDGAAPGTYIDNNGTIIVPTGGDGSGAWIRQYEYPVNIKFFGATGDGVTDDSDAVVAAVELDDGPVYFPPGDYYIADITTATNQTPAFTVDCLLIGDSSASVKIIGASDYSSSIRIALNTKLMAKDITFQKWKEVFYQPATGEGITYTLDDVLIDGCIFEDISVAGILCATQSIKNVQITNCIFRDFPGTTGNIAGIWLGSDYESSQITTQNYIISGNIFENITSTQNGADTHGVILWGEHATITDNQFRDIHNADYTSGSEAIYGKLRYSVISNNNIVDAGYSQSCINLKGSDRGSTGNTPQNYAHVVSGNNLLWTDTAQTNRRGFYVYGDNILFEGNYIENASLAITSSDEQRTGINISIKNNYIKLPTASGIFLTNNAGNIFVNGNVIESFNASSGTIRGIYVAPIDESPIVEISNNIIFVDSNYTASDIRCIQVGNVNPGSIDDLIISNNNISFKTLASGSISSILLTGVDIVTAHIEDNIIPDIPGVATTEYAEYLDIGSAANFYYCRNNGRGLDQTNIDGKQFEVSKSYYYDYTIDPNGSAIIGYLPDNVLVTRSWYEVRTNFTGVATVGIQISVDDALGILGATAVGTGWVVGRYEGIQDGAVANFSNPTTDIRPVQFVISAGNLLTGEAILHLKYVNI